MTNFAELDRVIAHCETHAKQHDQTTWFDLLEAAWIDDNELAENWQCHTTACVAGWAAILNGWRPAAIDSISVTDGDFEEYTATVARRILDLTAEQADLLFARTYDLASVRRVVAGWRAEQAATS